jgi:hypothetical protein
VSPLLSAEQRAELERLGPEHVRQKVVTFMGGHTGPESFVSGFACGQIRRDAIENWLSEAYLEDRRRNEASQSEAAEIARSAKKAAWIAAIAAIVALIIAIAAGIISVLAWLWPRAPQ